MREWKLVQGRTVPLGEVDRELRRAWTALDEDSRREGSGVMLGLREVNLVAVTREANLEQARATAALAARDHPGRIILVAPGGMGSSASIATGCLIDEESRRIVCSEEVVIRGAPAGEELLAAAILQLLVSDVPVIGWWTEDVAGAAESLPWLAGLSDQLVTDLGLAADPWASVEALTGLMSKMPELPVGDLEWLRIAPWRQLLAEVFERPERRQLIAEIAEVEILHADAPMQALLFAAWFSARLGMSVGAGARWGQEDHPVIEMVGSVGGALKVRLRRDELGSGPAGSGRLSGLTGVSIRMRAEGSADAARGAECFGRVISIARLAHSLVCRCGAEEGLDSAPVLKSLGLQQLDDHQLLSSLIDTPALDYDLTSILRVALDLSAAPGFVI
ncbi:MAG: glucose-6-phosphate dehydrogenase assembly protein OpcA [Actinobacteria bacterium]|nr:glucose-6-phosphate dehydrogenase assembly protein OpcA [Actinomycetota bacterium]